MEIDVPFYIAGIGAFALTFFLAYAVLRKYTYPAVEQPFFSDPAFFGLFVVGLIAGTVLLAFNTYLDHKNIIFMALFSVVLCLVMVAVLNLKRFHGKSDTVFYGYGIGLGMGCAMAFGTVYYYSTILNASDFEAGISDYAWFVMMAFSYIFILSSIGTTVGEGIARLRPMEFAMQAIFVNVVFGLILWAAYISDSQFSLYACVIMALIVSVAYFYYTMYAKLSRVVRDVLRMEGKKRNDVPK